MTEAAPTAAAEWTDVHALAPWDRNPRINDGEPVRKVARSILRFGFVAPICVWPDAPGDVPEIVAGHTRRKATLRLLDDDVDATVKWLDLDDDDAAAARERLGPGFTCRGAPAPGMVPVRFHSFTGEGEAHAYALADNKLNEGAVWDDQLGELMGELADEGFDLGELGWDDQEVAVLEGGIPDFLGGDRIDPDVKRTNNNMQKMDSGGVKARIFRFGDLRCVLPIDLYEPLARLVADGVSTQDVLDRWLRNALGLPPAAEGVTVVEACCAEPVPRLDPTTGSTDCVGCGAALAPQDDDDDAATSVGDQ